MPCGGGGRVGCRAARGRRAVHCQPAQHARAAGAYPGRPTGCCSQPRPTSHPSVCGTDVAGLSPAEIGVLAVRPGEHGTAGLRDLPQALTTPAGALMAHVLADTVTLEGSGEASAGAVEPGGGPYASASGSRSASPERPACGRAYVSAASRASCAAGGRSRARDDGCLSPAWSGAAAAAGAGPRSAAPASSAADGGSSAANCSEYASALASPESACGSALARDYAGAGAGGGSGPRVHGLCAAAGRAGAAGWEAGAWAAGSEGLWLGSGPAAGPADTNARRRAAEAEAAAARLSAALTAAAQRVKAREEQCRRLQAQLGHAQLRLVRRNIPIRLTLNI